MNSPKLINYAAFAERCVTVTLAHIENIKCMKELASSANYFAQTYYEDAINAEYEQIGRDIESIYFNI